MTPPLLAAQAGGGAGASLRQQGRAVRDVALPGQGGGQVASRSGGFRLTDGLFFFFFGMETGPRPRHAEPLVTRERSGRVWRRAVGTAAAFAGWMERRAAGMLKISISFFLRSAPETVKMSPALKHFSNLYKTMISACRFCCWRL